MLGAILFVLWSNLIVTAATNGVNLTDGLDGLAAGASVMVFGAYTLMGIWRATRPAVPRGSRQRLLLRAGPWTSRCWLPS